MNLVANTDRLAAGLQKASRQLTVFLETLRAYTANEEPMNTGDPNWPYEVQTAPTPELADHPLCSPVVTVFCQTCRQALASDESHVLCATCRGVGVVFKPRTMNETGEP